MKTNKYLPSIPKPLRKLKEILYTIFITLICLLSASLIITLTYLSFESITLINLAPNKSIEDVKSVATIVKDTVLAMAAFFTMVIAFAGLSKWRSEYKGTKRFDAARSLLMAVYQVRNHFQMARARLISNSEFPAEYDHGERDPNQRANATWYAYQKRIEPLTEAMSNLNISVLECEVIWGSTVTENGAILNRSYNRLIFSIKEFVRLEALEEEYSNNDSLKRIRQDIAASIDDNDDLTETINLAVSEFENLLKPHL